MLRFTRDEAGVETNRAPTSIATILPVVFKHSSVGLEGLIFCDFSKI